MPFFKWLKPCCHYNRGKFPQQLWQMSFLSYVGRQKVRILVLLVVVGLVFYSLKNAFSLGNEFLSEGSAIPKAPSPLGSLWPNNLHVENDYWSSVFQLFSENRPKIPNLESSELIRYTEKSKQVKGKTRAALLSRAVISDNTLKELQTKHQQVLRDLPVQSLWKTYRKGSKGIVMVGGGRFSWLSYLSIQELRATGLNIPVEIMLPSFEDFEKETDFCVKVLPKINARCRIIPEILGPTVMKNWSSELASYQLKSLAMIASSFQHILLLDSDNMAIQKPDDVFESKLYQECGMITWPDYWKRTISPHYYDIAGIKVNEHLRVWYNRMPLHVVGTSNVDDVNSVPYHDLEGTVPNPSTESGQLFINKELHAHTLMLSLYYNVFGPHLYYKLFSLGEPGEGDKDTFLAAAVAANQSFYQVKSLIRTYGYFDKNGEFRGVAMGQKSPLIDHRKYKANFIDVPYPTKPKSFKEQAKHIDDVMGKEFDTHDVESVMFLHCNFPKLDPLDLWSRDELYDKDAKKLRYRLFNGLSYIRPGEKEGKDDKKVDFELDQWSRIHRILCEERIEFPHLKDQNMEELCTFAKNQIDWLSGSGEKLGRLM